jgi:hypothetical protein
VPFDFASFFSHIKQYRFLLVLFAIALALLVCLAAAVAGHDMRHVPDNPLPAGDGDTGVIAFENASFTGTAGHDPGHFWLAEAGGSQSYGTGRGLAPSNAPEIRRLLAVDQYYRESGAARERLTLNDLRVRALETGGFTYNPLYGATPHCGYAVSLSGHEKSLDSGAITDDELWKYLRENSEQIKDPSLYIGGWIDDDRLYLDVSAVLQNETEARKTGRMNDQTGIFNLGTSEMIYLKGPDGKWLVDEGGNWLSGPNDAHDLSATEASTA